MTPEKLIEEFEYAVIARLSAGGGAERVHEAKQALRAAIGVTGEAAPADAVYVKLIRPEGYEDVHPELLVADAHIHPAFEPEIAASPSMGAQRGSAALPPLPDPAWKPPVVPTAACGAFVGGAVFKQPEMRSFTANVSVLQPMFTAEQMRDYGRACRGSAGDAGATECWCRACHDVMWSATHFVVCPDCGCKRCPHAESHAAACTGTTANGGHTCSGCAKSGIRLAGDAACPEVGEQ